MKKIENVVPQEPIEVLTLEETAIYLRMKPSQVRELCRRRCAHPIPFLKLGGRHVRFSRSAVSNWVTESKKGK